MCWCNEYISSTAFGMQNKIPAEVFDLQRDESYMSTVIRSDDYMVAREDENGDTPIVYQVSPQTVMILIEKLLREGVIVTRPIVNNISEVVLVDGTLYDKEDTLLAKIHNW